MNTLTLVLFLFFASIGIANASHHVKGHMSHHAWRASQTKASHISPRSCSAAQRHQARINACGEYVPSIYDPSPVSDY
ncbi:hypothetical protein [uncultured Methylovirgula sp.]|uniref:hypothetical protein n=1 Tax=uncultured Methylovirgula sp. TaxID=1285960 RepID=UPI00261EB8CF|nr:hypothetical protein [uncultured Methylovirgula sp.]